MGGGGLTCRGGMTHQWSFGGYMSVGVKHQEVSFLGGGGWVGDILTGDAAKCLVEPEPEELQQRSHQKQMSQLTSISSAVKPSLSASPLQSFANGL